VWVNKDKNTALFSITNTQDLINILIPIFDKRNLNTTKYLDYLLFKEILLICIKKEHLTKSGLIKIENLRSQLNTNRTEFKFPVNHIINITPYWLLGFLEGDGSFTIGHTKPKKFYCQFTISLTESQRPVLEKIKIFIDKMGINQLNYDLPTPIDRCSINFRKSRSQSQKGQYALIISDIYFIYHYFIPFLIELSFFTKKGLDFNDWVIGINILVKGLHLIEQGKNLILEIISSMNSNRLSAEASNIYNHSTLHEKYTSPEQIGTFPSDPFLKNQYSQLLSFPQKI